MIKKFTTENFIKEAEKVYGKGRYDYSETDLDNRDNKGRVKIICHCKDKNGDEHGAFWKNPYNFLRRHQGCKKCSRAELSLKVTTPLDEFIAKARKVHGDKYDYSQTDLTNRDEKGRIKIICPKHGEFWQDPSSHLQGHGCDKCAHEKIGNQFRLSKEDFLEKAREIHGDKYEYDLSNYCNNRSVIKIKCPTHGWFSQEVCSHLQGHGCDKCAHEKSADRQRTNKLSFLQRANAIHDGKYEYDLRNFHNMKSIIGVKCPVHGWFSQEAFSHLQGHGCPKCSHMASQAENEIAEYVKSLVGTENVIQNSKDIIYPLELDVYVPLKQIAIEYNGLRWHSEQFGKDRNYHLNKLSSCNAKGIKLIQIFEDEYVNNKELVLKKIKYALGMSEGLPKVFARKCQIKEIDNVTAKRFLNKNHIQGFALSTIYIGCFYDNELIGVMSFKVERKNNDKWELTRFATDNNKLCVGVGSKMFHYFLKNYNPSEVKSFADRRWTLNGNDNLYIKLGFQLEKTLHPDYRYFLQSEYGMKRIHKFNFRKQILHNKYGLPLSLTETEMTAKIGAYRIWDCGLFKYVWHKTNK